MRRKSLNLLFLALALLLVSVLAWQKFAFESPSEAWKVYQKEFYLNNMPEAMAALDRLFSSDIKKLDYPLSFALEPRSICTWGRDDTVRPNEIVSKIKNTISFAKLENKELAFASLNKLLATQKAAFPTDDFRIGQTYEAIAHLHNRFDHKTEAAKNFAEAGRIMRLYLPADTVVVGVGQIQISKQGTHNAFKDIKERSGTPEEQLEIMTQEYKRSLAECPYGKKTLALLTKLISKSHKAKRSDLVTKYGIEREQLQERLELLTQEKIWAQNSRLALYTIQAKDKAGSRMWLNKLEKGLDYEPSANQLITLAELEYFAEDKEKANRFLKLAEYVLFSTDSSQHEEVDERIKRLQAKLSGNYGRRKHHIE